MKARIDLAKADEEIGNFRQAVEDLRPLAARDKEGEVHYRLAELYRKLGEKALAQEALAAFKKLHDATLEASRDELDAVEKEREKAEQPSPTNPPK